MVKFRGIEISIISQFDIRKLPEFRFRQQCVPPPDPSRPVNGYRSPSSKAIASCYVPVYPGSQIWFEYCIDGPHPPQAAYFFKLLLDGKVVTSWDCTEKHNYHGKMMYNLAFESDTAGAGKTVILRQALKFTNEVENENEPTEQKDVIEICVHRIEHRQRIRDLSQAISQINGGSKPEDSLQLSNGGLLEPGLPCRRYKYQLLDPVDEPYATFRFYYRTYDFLEKHGIVGTPQSLSSSPASSEWHEPLSIPGNAGAGEVDDVSNQPETPSSSPVEYCIKMVSSPSDITESTISQEQVQAVSKFHVYGRETYVPPSDSEESLSIVTKDSIEDLPSTVSRSPKSPKFQEQVQGSVEKDDPDTIPALSPPVSPRRRLKKKVTLNLNGAEFDLEPKRRPLSPFTSGGMLRKLTGGVPPSAPAAVTEFGPTLDDEVRDMIKAESKPAPLWRTTRTERGGKSLMGFLGRRIGSA